MPIEYIITIKHDTHPISGRKGVSVTCETDGAQTCSPAELAMLNKVSSALDAALGQPVSVVQVVKDVTPQDDEITE